jgi:HSP20 family protein
MVMSSWDWNGGDRLRPVRLAWDRLFDDLTENYFVLGGPLLFPAINLWEDNDNFIVQAEIPGLKMEDLEITAQGRDLTLRGERKDPGDASESYQRRERFVGPFVRILTLPTDVDAGKIQASLENGILQITVPKSAAAKPRRIDVKSSGQKEVAKEA